MVRETIASDDDYSDDYYDEDYDYFGDMLRYDIDIFGGKLETEEDKDLAKTWFEML